MKSFENINILIKVKLFCLKNLFFFWKKVWILKKNPSNFFFQEMEKSFIKNVEKKFFLEKILFLKKKT